MANGDADEAISDAVEGDGDGVVVGAVYGALEKVARVPGGLVGVGGIGDLFPVEVVDGCAGVGDDAGDGEFPELAVERSVERAGIVVQVEIAECGGAGPGGCRGKGALWWFGGADGGSEEEAETVVELGR